MQNLHKLCLLYRFYALFSYEVTNDIERGLWSKCNVYMIMYIDVDSSDDHEDNKTCVKLNM